MAGTWVRSGTIALTSGSKKVTGIGTAWNSGLNKVTKGCALKHNNIDYEVDYVNSDTELYLVDTYTAATLSGQAYRIQIAVTDTIPELSSRIAQALAYWNGQGANLQLMMSGSGNVTLTFPDGTQVTIPAWGNMQPKDALLTAIANLTTSADKLFYATGSDAVAMTTLSAKGRELIADADASAMLTTLGVSAFIKSLLANVDAATARSTLGALGSSDNASTASKLSSPVKINGVNFDGSTDIIIADSSKQPSDATLTSIAGLTTAADKIVYFTGVDVAALTTLTSFSRTLLDDADAVTARATLGVQAADSVLTSISSLPKNSTGNIKITNGVASLDAGGGSAGAITYDATLYNYKGSASELTSNTLGAHNIAIGRNALFNNTSGNANIAIGRNALYNNISGTDGPNTAVGAYALYNNTSGLSNAAFGEYTLNGNTTGNYNTGLGARALFSAPTGSYNTAVGAMSGSGSESYNNTTCIGYSSTVTASNQVQLGNSSTTTYVYGTVQNRSDIRDKADIVDSELGLDFILGLRPVQGVWNFREDYIERKEIIDDDGNLSFEIINHPNDGSKKRTRKHNWFIAQEVKTLCDRLGVDFGGYQDHSLAGGGDILSLGYDEFIPPVVKSIQQCVSKLNDIELRLSKLETK